jgi:hypothetical protein
MIGSPCASSHGSHGCGFNSRVRLLSHNIAPTPLYPTTLLHLKDSCIAPIPWNIDMAEVRETGLFGVSSAAWRKLHSFFFIKEIIAL